MNINSTKHDFCDSNRTAAMWPEFEFWFEQIQQNIENAPRSVIEMGGVSAALAFGLVLSWRALHRERKQNILLRSSLDATQSVLDNEIRWRLISANAQLHRGVEVAQTMTSAARAASQCPQCNEPMLHRSKTDANADEANELRIPRVQDGPGADGLLARKEEVVARTQQTD